MEKEDRTRTVRRSERLRRLRGVDSAIISSQRDDSPFMRTLRRKWSVVLRDRSVPIHCALERIPVEESWYSLPENYSLLPYPSLQRPCIVNFSIVRRDDIRFFPFMGRASFAEVFGHYKKFLDGRDDTRKLALIGPVGTGRSSLLAAFACLLSRLGKHVVFIPNCSLLQRDFIYIMKPALYFAIPPDLHTAIDAVDSFEEIMELLHDFKKDYFVFVFLNWDALYYYSSRISATERATFFESIDKITSNHYSVYSISLNVEWPQALKACGDIVDTINLNEGLVQSEMSSWWAHNAENLPEGISADDKEEIQYYTGCMPLYLKGLLDFPGRRYQDIKADYLKNKIFSSSRHHMRLFIERKLLSISNGESEKKILIDHMRACLQGTAPKSTTERDGYYDRRFSYFADGVGHFISGQAYDEAAMLLQSWTSSFYDDDSWITAARDTSNPALKKLLLTQICLSRIFHNGLGAVDERLVPMPHKVFDVPLPTWSPAADMCYLFIPSRLACALIDGIVYLQDEESKALDLFFIQVGVTADSKANDETFYLQKWKMVSDSLSSSWATRKSAVSTNYVFLHLLELSPREEKKKVVGDDWAVEYSLHTMSIVTLDAELKRVV